MKNFFTNMSGIGAILLLTSCGASHSDKHPSAPPVANTSTSQSTATTNQTPGNNTKKTAHTSPTASLSTLKQPVHRDKAQSTTVKPVENKATKNPAPSPNSVSSTHKLSNTVKHTTAAISQLPKPHNTTVHTASKPTTVSSSSDNTPATHAANASKGGYRDPIAGVLKNADYVPCGGLWQYVQNSNGIYYAREVSCPDSQRYFALAGGAKIVIGNRSCVYKGFEDLNYMNSTLNDAVWLGNVIVQICKTPGAGVAQGDVRLFSFSCS